MSCRTRAHEGRPLGRAATARLASALVLLLLLGVTSWLPGGSHPGPLLPPSPGDVGPAAGGHGPVAAPVGTSPHARAPVPHPIATDRAGGSGAGVASSGWVELGTPPARSFAMSAVDVNAGYDLVFGGNGTSGYLGDTWELTYSYANSVYNEGQWADWVPVTTPVAPSARMAGAAAYDAWDGTVVLFGGFNGTYLGDTWVYNAGIWTPVRTTNAPSPRAYAAMTWDNQLDALVLFGGEGPGGALNDTWTYANGTWTPLPLSHAPTPRFGAALVGDATAKFDLLFGGSNGSGETWKFAQGLWTQLAPTLSPPGRLFASAVASGGSPELFLFGGSNGAPMNDIWSWSAGNWVCQACSGTGPSPRVGALLTDLPVGAWPLMATGSSGGNETWWFHSGTWTQDFLPSIPQPFGGPAMAFDPVTQQSVLVGGAVSGGYWTVTWALTGSNWSLLNSNSPNDLNRYLGSIAWDGADQSLLYFGGYSTGPLNDTFQYSGSAGWAPVATNHGPPARLGASFAYDPVDQYDVLFGGSPNLALTRLDQDTWTYRAGVWTNITSTAGVPPPARAYGQMVWDARDSSLVLFGGNGPQPLNDTWTFVAGRWTQVHTPVSPPARDSAGFVYDGSTGESYLLGGYNGVPLGDLWAYFAGSWTEITPNAPFGPLAGVQATYDATQRAVVVFGGTGPVQYELNTWLWSPSAVPFTSSASVNATVVDGTRPLAFTGTVSGGVPPYTYTWRFGDGGVAPSLTATHTYAQPGTYVASLFVNDSIGDALVRPLTVTENALLSASPSATPTRVEVGVAVTFSPGVQGGTAPLNYTWNFQDGSAEAFGPSPQHAFTTPQNATVLLTVSDALGASVTSSVMVQVVTGPLAVSAIALPVLGIVPFNVSFTGSVHGGTPPYGVLWNFGDGSTNTSEDTTHGYAVPGVYEVRFYGGDSGGSVRVRFLNITALSPSPLTVSPTEAPTSGGAPLSVDFSAVVQGGSLSGYVYDWNFGDGSLASSVVPSTSHLYTAPGLYTPTLVVTDSGGDEASETLPPVTVTATGAAGVLAVHANAVPLPKVSPTDVAFTASIIGGTPGYTYLWGFGDGSTSTSAAPTHAYPSQGDYNVSLTVTDSSVPSQSASTTLQVNVGQPGANQLQLSVAADPQNGFAPLPVSFATVASGGSGAYVDYTWTFGDGQNASGPYASHTYTHAGTFPVEVFVTDTLGDRDTVFLNVSVHTPSLVVTVRATPADLGTAPYTVALLASAAGGTGTGYTYVWDFGDQTNGTGAAVGHTYGSPGNYTVSVTVTDSGGDVGSTTLTVQVVAPVVPRSTPTVAGFLGLPNEAWYLITPLLVVLGIMAAVLFLTLRRPMVVATKAEEEETAPPVGDLPEWPAQPLVVLETADESGALTMAEQTPKEDLLVITRQPPEGLAAEKGLEPTNVWQLAVSEGDNRLRPGDLEQIGHLIERHLSGGQGRRVVLTGVDMLLDATSLKSVRRLLAVAREVADEHRGRVLVALNPKGLGKEDRAHLEEGATVVKH